MQYSLLQLTFRILEVARGVGGTTTREECPNAQIHQSGLWQTHVTKRSLTRTRNGGFGGEAETSSSHGRGWRRRECKATGSWMELDWGAFCSLALTTFKHIWCMMNWWDSEIQSPPGRLFPSSWNTHGWWIIYSRTFRSWFRPAELLGGCSIKVHPDLRPGPSTRP